MARQMKAGVRRIEIRLVSVGLNVKQGKVS